MAHSHRHRPNTQPTPPADYEHTLDPHTRHRHGAHYTAEPDILRVIGPTIVDPWRVRIAAATRETLPALATALENFHVLDPACGTGNFLLVARRELLALAAALLDRARELGLPAPPLNISSHQLHGIDRDPDAAAIARQRLVSLAGVEPEPAAADPSISVSLADEAPLPTFVDGHLDQVASIKADLADARTSEVQVRAATALFFPTISASANERFTNATGFLGKYTIASASLNLSWRIDLAIIPQLRAAKVQAQLAQVRVDRSRQRVYDQIHGAWHQVKAAVAKARSARVERDTTRAAHKQARQRYEAGTGIFLEVTQAERDAFSAHISLIQANADLAYARIALRLAAGRDLKETEALLRDDGADPGPAPAPTPAPALAPIPDGAPPPLAPVELAR